MIEVQLLCGTAEVDGPLRKKRCVWPSYEGVLAFDDESLLAPTSIINMPRVIVSGDRTIS